jgi:hypothetical protein
MSLRFVEREGLAPFTMHMPFGGSPEKRMYRVLQQMFRDPRGGDAQIWRDVPLVQESA